MLLLDAVNTCLSALGEARVTSTTVRHPTVDLIKGTLDMKKAQLLEHGYWFNQADVTMYPSSTGEMEYPATALSVLGFGGEILVPRDGMLFDLDNNTQFFTEAKTMRVWYDVDFEDLPECAATVVMCRAAGEVYAGDLGVDSAVQRLNQLELQAMTELHMQHLRNKRFSTRQRRGFQRLRSALNG